MNATSSAGIEHRTRRMKRFVLIATIVGLGIVGCGGGGGGSSGGETVSTTNPRVSTDVGAVTITVTDVFGAPAAGASVIVRSSANGGWGSESELVADAQGKAVHSRVPVGEVDALAWSDSPLYALGSSREIKLSAGEHVDLAMTITPASDTDGASGGFAASNVSADAVSADGRTVDFTLRVFTLSEGAPYLQISPCSAEHTGGIACVSGPTGSVAEYSVDGGGNATATARIGGSTPAPFAITLLTDQSRTMAAIDPWDARLFAMKYFLVRKPPADSVLLAAFAADDVAAGERSQLPQQPVSLFPLEDPRFIAAPNELLSTIDALESLEGGAAPLYASIEALIDYTATHAPGTVRRAVVVLTDGTDDTCGSAAQCAAARERVIERSRTRAVPIVVVALLHPDPWWTAGVWSAAELAERTGGIVLWAANASDLGVVLERLPAILNGTATLYTGRFRIRASTDGAFRSGAIVRGNLSWGWGALPFAVQIP